MLKRIGPIERCLLLVLLCLATQLVVRAVQIWKSQPSVGRQTSATADIITQDDEYHIQYWVYLPQNYLTETAWPLLLFLHGAGQRGDDLNSVARYGPPRFIAQGNHLPMIVVSPQCPRDEMWNSNQLLLFLDYLEKTFKVNHSQIYVAGHSMGASAAWELISVAQHDLRLQFQNVVAATLLKLRAFLACQFGYFTADSTKLFQLNIACKWSMQSTNVAGVPS